MSEEKPVKPGVETTEFKEAQQGQVMSIIGMVLGILMVYAPKILELTPEDSKYAVIGGAVVTVASVVHDTLVKLGYINSRTQVKVAAEKEAE